MSNKLKKVFAYFPIVVAIASAIFVYWLLGIYGSAELKRMKRANEELLHRELDQNRSVIEQKISGQKDVAKSLAQYVEFNPDINRGIFSKWAESMFVQSNPQALTFSLVRENEVSLTYPKQSNSTIRLKLKEPVFREYKEGLDSVNKVLTFFDRDLLNGKPAIIYQNFIYTMDSIQMVKKYWGSAVIIDDLSTIMESVPYKSNTNRSFNIEVLASEGQNPIRFGSTLSNEDLSVSEQFDLQSLTIRLNLGSELLYETLEKKTLGFRVLFISIAIIIALLNGYLIANMFSMQRVNKVLASKNKLIHAQLGEKVLLIKEIHHRIKNHFQLISSLNRSSTASLRDKSIEEVIDEINNRIELMAKAYDQISGASKVNNFMPDYVPSIVESLTNSVTKPINVQYQIVPLSINIKRTVYIGILLNELVTNTIKHGFSLEMDERIIRLEFETIADRFLLRYSDNGKGLPEDMLSTAKDSTGVQILSLFTNQLEGDIIQFQEGAFHGVEIEFPV